MSSDNYESEFFIEEFLENIPKDSDPSGDEICL